MLDGEDQPFTHYIGSIVSHRGYPQNYYFNNVDSTRKMEVAGVLSITLRVIFFQLEPHGMVGECLDFLQIGNDVQLCGTDLQAGDMKTFLEADGELELRFSTNSRSTKTGFRIRYQYSGECNVKHHLVSIGKPKLSRDRFQLELLFVWSFKPGIKLSFTAIEDLLFDIYSFNTHYEFALKSWHLTMVIKFVFMATCLCVCLGAAHKIIAYIFYIIYMTFCETQCYECATS